MPSASNDPSTLEQRKARVLIEKKTVINLIEAFGVAVKHYLRGEEGVYYVDLYHLVKFLPSYALPAGLPSQIDVTSADGLSTHSPLRNRGDSVAAELTSLREEVASLPEMPASPTGPSASMSQLPFPATATCPRKVSHVRVDLPPRTSMNGRGAAGRSYDREKPSQGDKSSMYSGVSGMQDENFLLPARNPPKYHLFDLFPFSLLVHALTKRGKDVKVSPVQAPVVAEALMEVEQGKKAARIRAKLRSKTVTHNLPLEISLYLVRILEHCFACCHR